MHPAGNFKFVEGFQVVSAIEPHDLNASAIEGDIVSLENWQRVAMILHGAIGTATTGDLTVTIQQMTDVGDTLSDHKALNFTRMDYKQGLDLSAIGQFTSYSPAATNVYTNATSGETEQIYLWDFAAQDFDIANDFDCCRMNVAATTSSKYVSGLYILYGAKFGTDQLPSAIVD